MRKRIVFSVAVLIAVLATPSTTTPLEFKDDAEAVRLAAEQGDADAQFNLGLKYANGWGVLEDDAEAVRWYRLAAEQGDADAQFNLGLMYDTGEDVLKDDAEAVRWYRMAAEQGPRPWQIPPVSACRCPWVHPSQFS